MDKIRDMVYINLFSDIDSLVRKIEFELPKLAAAQIEAVRDAHTELLSTTDATRNTIETSVMVFRVQLDALRRYTDSTAKNLKEDAAKLQQSAQAVVEQTSKQITAKSQEEIHVFTAQIKSDMLTAGKAAAAAAVTEAVKTAFGQAAEAAQHDIETTTTELRTSVIEAGNQIDRSARKIGCLSGRIIFCSIVASFLGALLGGIFSANIMADVIATKVAQMNAETSGKTESEQSYDNRSNLTIRRSP